MSKFAFASQFVPDQLDTGNIASKTTVEFEADTLDEVLGQFTQFLRGAGFCFEGDVEIVDNSLPLTDTETKDVPVPANLEAKGKFYVDPPGGWKHGFPRPYNMKTDGPLREFFIKNGYPEKDATWAANNCRFFGVEEYNKQYN